MLIAGQKSGMVHAIDPDRQGAIVWQRRLGRGGSLGGVQWGSAVDQDNVYVALSDVMARLPGGGTGGGAEGQFRGGGGPPAAWRLRCAVHTQSRAPADVAADDPH